MKSKLFIFLGIVLALTFTNTLNAAQRVVLCEEAYMPT